MVEHKYGSEVGQVSRDVGGAVTDLGRTAVSVKKMGITSLAERSAKQTAVTLLSSEKEQLDMDKNAPVVDPMTKMAASMALANLKDSNK